MVQNKHQNLHSSNLINFSIVHEQQKVHTQHEHEQNTQQVQNYYLYR